MSCYISGGEICENFRCSCCNTSSSWWFKFRSCWLFNFDLVETLFASIPAVQQAVYVLVGLSAVYQIIGLKEFKQDGMLSSYILVISFSFIEVSSLIF